MTENNTTGQPDWSALRVRYEQGGEKVRDIAKAAGVSGLVLSLKAKALGWKLRTAARRKSPKAKAAKKGESTRDTLLRLKELLQERVTQLESEVKQLGLDVDALTNERQIKSVNIVVRTLEKVLDLERKDKLKRKQQSREFKHYDDEQRRALADRIARLRTGLEGDNSELGTSAAGRGGTELPVAVLGETPPATSAGEG